MYGHFAGTIKTGHNNEVAEYDVTIRQGSTLHVYSSLLFVIDFFKQYYSVVLMN